MTKHEIEEAVNQGTCSLRLELDAQQVRAILLAPDALPVSQGKARLNGGGAGDAALGDSVRDAYRNLFNDVESRYSQKLCRLTGVTVRPAPGAAEAAGTLPDRLSAALGDGGSLTEAGVRLLDPAGNLRPGIPVRLTGEEKAWAIPKAKPAEADAKPVEPDTPAAEPDTPSEPASELDTPLEPDTPAAVSAEPESPADSDTPKEDTPEVFPDLELLKILS